MGNEKRAVLQYVLDKVGMTGKAFEIALFSVDNANRGKYFRREKSFSEEMVRQIKDIINVPTELFLYKVDDRYFCLPDTKENEIEVDKYFYQELWGWTDDEELANMEKAIELKGLIDDITWISKYDIDPQKSIERIKNIREQLKKQIEMDFWSDVM